MSAGGFVLAQIVGYVVYMLARTHFPRASGIVIDVLVIGAFIWLAYYAFRHSFSRE